MTTIDTNTNTNPPNEPTHSTPTCTHPHPIDDSEPSEFTEAFQRRQSEIFALPPADLVHVTLDVRGTVATVIGALVTMAPYAASIEQLPFMDRALFAGLKDYAQALWHAHGLYLGSAPGAEAITPLYEEAIKLRETLLSDVASIAHRGVIDPRKLEQIKGLTGFKNVAADLSGLAETLTECWPAIEGKTLLQFSEVARARNLGEQLVSAVGVRDVSAPVSASAAETRQRAFSLLLKAYEETRRAVAYLRWHEQDADSIAPSLFAGRGVRTKTDRVALASPATTQPVAAPAPHVTGIAPPAVPGGPGGDPYAH